MSKKAPITKKQKLIDQHHDLTMSIALQSIRIIEMQKVLEKQSDELLLVEAVLEKLELEESGSGAN